MPPVAKKDTIHYEYEKTSGLVFIVFILFALLVSFFAVLKGLNLTVLILTVILILSFLALYRLNVVIYGNSIEITYGMDFHTKRLPMTAVKGFYIVSNNSLFARLYQPLAGLILEISLKNGKSVLLPVPDTKAVMEVLNRIRFAKH